MIRASVSVFLSICILVACGQGRVHAQKFLFVSANQTFNELNCAQKGFEGVVLSGQVVVKPATGARVTLVCGHVRFEKGARLISLGDLTLVAQTRLEGEVDIVADAPNPRPKVVVRKAVGASAKSGSHGRSGRNVRKVQLCTTSFRSLAEARLMDGFPGQDGEDGIAGRTGPHGADGIKGRNVRLLIGGLSPDARIKIRTRGSDGLPGELGERGQNGGDGGNGGNGADGRAAIPCRAADNAGDGADGGKGGSGGRGGDGGHGGRGGYGGNVIVELKTRDRPAPNFIMIDNLGGKGGGGGRENVGGFGGKGGKAGERGRGGAGLAVRSPGDDGFEGKAGLNGRQGLPGQTGKRGTPGSWGEAIVFVSDTVAAK